MLRYRSTGVMLRYRSTLILAALLCATVFCTVSARADVRGDAHRLLAQRVRSAHVDPSSIVINDVVVVRDQALLSWSAGTHSGIMGLVRTLDRWWDAFDEVPLPAPPRGMWTAESTFPLKPAPFSCPAPPVDPRSVGFTDQVVTRAAFIPQPMLPSPTPRGSPSFKDSCFDEIYDGTLVVDGGGDLRFARSTTSGYDVHFYYSRNDAEKNVRFSRFTVRAPEKSEMLPSPTPPHGWGGPNGVFFVSFEIDGKAPVHFQAGSTLDVWFPFVLDDQIRYELSMATIKTPVPPVLANAFDNSLHFALPAFTVAPGETVFAEIDGLY